MEGEVTLKGTFDDIDYDVEGLRLFTVTELNGEPFHVQFAIKREDLTIPPG